MRQISKAIEYVIKELGISAFELNQLLKNADNNKSGSYSAYLAKQLQVLAEEKWSIPPTQLLAKWGEYIIEIEENSAKNSAETMSDEILAYFERLESDDLVMCFDSLSSVLPAGNLAQYEGTAWASHIDLDDVNTYFIDGGGSEFKDTFENADTVTLVADFTTNTQLPAGATTDIKVLAKDLYNTTIKSYSDLVLVRALNMVEAHDIDEFKVVIISRTDFWADKERQALHSAFLKNFALIKTDSFYIDARKVRSSNMRDSDFVITSFIADFTGTKNIRLGDINGYNLKLFYSHGIKQRQLVLSTLPEPNMSSYTITSDGELSNKKTKSGYEGALGYYTINGVETFESLPREGARYNVPVTSKNIEQLAILSAMGTALEHDIRYSAGLPVILDGLPSYQNLVADCLPFLFFGSRSNFKDWGVKRTVEGVEVLKNLMVTDSPQLSSVLNTYLPLMSLKAKQFWTFALDIAEDEGMHFIKYRDKVINGEVKDVDFISDYSMYENNALDFIISTYSHLISEV